MKSQDEAIKEMKKEIAERQAKERREALNREAVRQLIKMNNVQFTV